MTDLPTITAFFGSLRTATDIAKLITSSDTELEKAVLKMKLADMLEALAEAKIKATAIREELAERDEVISSLRKHIEIAENVVYKSPYYFVKIGEDLEGPYCQQCYDSESKLIHLQQPGRAGFWTCRNCKNSFKDDSCETAKPIAIRRGKNWVTDFL